MINALEIRNLTKTFKDFKLDNISLSLPSGCIMGLIGENGAGKSTLIKLILDSLHKDSGEITILGKDNTENITLTKEEVGVVPDVIGIPGFLTAKQIGNIMKHTFRSWDDDAYKSYLYKLSVPTDKEFKDFSQGTKMKLGITIAMSHNSRLLLLDEPTNGLDPVVRDEVVDMFSEFTRDEGHSVLISSHIVSDLEKICDYIAFLHKGKLMLCEEKDILLEKYAIVYCTKEQLGSIEQSSIISKKENPYGMEIIMPRKAVPKGLQIGSISIEELFVHMAKEKKE